MIVVSEALRAYLESKLDLKLSPHAQFIGRLYEDGSIWGVVAFDNFTTYDCEIFMAGEPGWMTRRMCKAVFGYPFTQLGKMRVTGRVDAADDKTLEIDRRLGFRVEGRLRHALGDRDIIVIGMLRSECKWIEDYGQEKHTRGS